MISAFFILLSSVFVGNLLWSFFCLSELEDALDPSNNLEKKPFLFVSLLSLIIIT